MARLVGVACLVQHSVSMVRRSRSIARLGLCLRWCRFGSLVILKQVVAGGGVESSDAVAVVVHEFNNVLVVAEVGVSADTVGGCAVFADGVFGGDGFGCFCVGDDGGGGGAYGL